MSWFDQTGTGGYSEPSLSLTDPAKGYSGYSGTTTPAASSGSGSTTLMGLSMVTSAFGAISAGISQAAAYRAQGAYQKAVADTNAKLAGLESSQVLAAGDIAASRKNLETRGIVGTERAVQGASGVDVGSGSAALTRISSEFAGKIDELTIRNNAARTAWGYQTQAIQDTYQGQFAKMTATNQAQASLLNGGLAAISGPLGIASNYLRFSRGMSGSGSGQPYNMSTS